MATPTAASPEPAKVEADVVLEDAKDEVKDEDGANEETEAAAPGPGISNEMAKIMKGIVDYLTEYKDENGHEVAGLFQRMLNRRLIPDYFDVIKEPTAFSTVRGKLLRKQYKNFAEFVRDFALISHNAQVYNRPSAPVYQDALRLRELFKLELAKLVDRNIITPEDAILPDLGEIPEVEDSPPPGPDDEEAEEEEEDDDEDEEDEDSDEERPKRRRGRPSNAARAKREDSKADDGAKEDDAHKKRGRPPKVHTPMEARINAILKGLRKFKNPSGDLKILPFERLPDKAVMPEYYQEVKNPIAMDIIKRKAKRKKYQSVDQTMKDVELMFENAKAYNVEESQVYKDAVDLQREARILAEQEKKKPDSDFVDEDGRLPLSEILHNGEIWKVGDWVHLQNPNDLTKPIVAQIYRTWQDPEGQKWINACWYYRPEQTVHRYEKHFYENEVVKTGQYRDHHIDEVVDRCFVMFFTRYNKGRPRGFPPDKEVYVCEARYNEEKFKLNKIKTWASCVPDEVREKDYEMDLFDTPRRMKKVPSPIKHLLREDAKEDDPLPKPTWGAANAPPIVGAVHKRPREANESPPPEATPSPEPEPAPIAQPVRRQSTNDRIGAYAPQADVSMGMTPTHASRSPMVTTNQPPPPYNPQYAPTRPSASPAPALAHHTSYGSHTSSHPTPAPLTPHVAPQPAPAYTSQYTSTVPAVLPPTTHTTNPVSTYDTYRSPAITTTTHRSSMPITSSATTTGSNAYNPPRPVEVYHLSDVANASIPISIREQFHRDEQGRILFFTAPPLDVSPVPEATKKQLGHSLKYLAAKAREKREKKPLVVDDKENGPSKHDIKHTVDAQEEVTKRLKLQVTEVLGEQIQAGTESLYRDLYGEDWHTMYEHDQERLKIVQAQEAAKAADMAQRETARRQETVIRLGATGL